MERTDVDNSSTSSIIVDEEEDGRPASKRAHIQIVDIDKSPSSADVSTLHSDFLKRRKHSSNNKGVGNTVSQELRCPICLAEKEDTTMLSECQHAFCHACILEWLKMKPECPLCKRVPKFFKHNFNVKGSPPTWETPGQLEGVSDVRAAAEMESIQVASSYAADVERHAVQQVVQRLEEEVRMLEHMKIRSYTSGFGYAAVIKSTQDDLAAYQQLAAMFAMSSRRELFREPAFRRVVYLRNLSPRSIVAPHFAVVFNADYVRAHEATVRTQLMPFILREFVAITQQTSVDVDELMRVIFDYLAQRSGRMQAVHFLQQHGVRHPHQFLNNLAHFAGTGQTIDVYDQNSEYTPRSPGVLPYMSGSDDILVLNSAVNNDIQVVGESTAPVSRGGGIHRDVDANRRVLERFSRRLAALTGANFRSNSDAPASRAHLTLTAQPSQQQRANVTDPYDFHASTDYMIGRQTHTSAAAARNRRRSGEENSSGGIVVNIDDSDHSSDSDDLLEPLDLEEIDEEEEEDRHGSLSIGSDVGRRLSRLSGGTSRSLLTPIVVEENGGEDTIEPEDDDNDIATVD